MAVEPAQTHHNGLSRAAVRVTPQSFTTAEQTQARTNIGAQSSSGGGRTQIHTSLDLTAFGTLDPGTGNFIALPTIGITLGTTFAISCNNPAASILLLPLQAGLNSIGVSVQNLDLATAIAPTGILYITAFVA